MGGGDLNLKKSWHPKTFRNVEKLWKVETKDRTEKLKIQQLQRELQEERNIEELHRQAVEAGHAKPRDGRLDWMYAGPAANTTGFREEYLLGKRIDDKVMPAGKEAIEKPASSSASFQPLDQAAKLREDPLLMIKLKEKESLKRILENPLKRRELMEQIDKKKSQKKEKKSKKQKKESKKHKKRKLEKETDSSDDDSTPQESPQNQTVKSVAVPSCLQEPAGVLEDCKDSLHRDRQHERHTSRDDRTSSERSLYRDRQHEKHTSRDDRTSSERSLHRDRQDHRSERDRSSDSSSHYSRRHHSNSRKDARQPDRSTQKATSEKEREARLREMQADAIEIESARKKLIHSERERIEAEEKLEVLSREKNVEALNHQGDAGLSASFLKSVRHDAFLGAGVGTVEERLQRNRHFLSKTASSLENNPWKN